MCVCVCQRSVETYGLTVVVGEMINLPEGTLMFLLSAVKLDHPDKGADGGELVPVVVIGETHTLTHTRTLESGFHHEEALWIPATSDL